MKRNEIRTKIRYNIRESTAEIWANAELNYWINDVQKEVASVLNPEYNPDLIQIYSVSAASGTDNYTLASVDPPFLRMLGNADLASNTYVRTPISVVRPQITDQYAYHTSKKISYLRDDKLYLHPTPGSSEDNKLITF